MNIVTQDDLALLEKFQIVASGAAHGWRDEVEMNDHFRRLLTNYVRRRLGKFSSEWEDALQSSFGHAWEHRATSPTHPKTLRIWLFRIARGVCVNMVRRRRKTEPLPAIDPVSPAAGPVTQLRHKETAAQVASVLASLPERLSEVVRMHHIEDLSVRAIAKRTGLGVQFVYRRLEEAKAWFRKLVTTVRRRKPRGHAALLEIDAAGCECS